MSEKVPAEGEGKLRLLIPPESIAEAVHRIAGQIRQDYQGTRPLMIGTLKGAFVFLADLVRVLNVPVEIDFVRFSSYGKGKVPGGVRVVQGLRSDVRGRHLLVVEDIVDTGYTQEKLFRYLRRKRPASLRLCALLDKTARRRAPVTIDYCGFTVGDYFVVGYGIDCAEQYRYLPGVYALEEE